MSNVLYIPDLHIPFEHRDALRFVCKVRDKYKCDTIIQGGDLFDNYAWSRYIKDPDSLTPRREFNISKARIKYWVKEFPVMTITTGNHCIRLMKKLKEVGIPADMIKQSFNDLWGVPDTWKWVDRYKFDGILYIHGAKSGEYAHVNNAKDMRCNTISCHTHSSGGIHFLANYEKNIFGMNGGCLVNDKTYAFYYANEFTRRPVLGCGVVIDGYPQFIPLK
jgi:hypothetical protein